MVATEEKKDGRGGRLIENKPGITRMHETKN